MFGNKKAAQLQQDLDACLKECESLKIEKEYWKGHNLSKYNDLCKKIEALSSSYEKIKSNFYKLFKETILNEESRAVGFYRIVRDNGDWKVKEVTLQSFEAIFSITPKSNQIYLEVIPKGRLLKNDGFSYQFSCSYLKRFETFREAIEYIESTEDKSQFNREELVAAMLFENHEDADNFCNYINLT